MKDYQKGVDKGLSPGISCSTSTNNAYVGE